MVLKYMHLIEKEPARFSGEQICYAGNRGFKIELLDSLKQIIKEQKLSKEFRESQGWKEKDLRYGYALVEVEK